MTSQLGFEDLSMFNTLDDVFECGDVVSADSVVSSGPERFGPPETKSTVVHKAGKTEAKQSSSNNENNRKRSWKKPKDKPKRPLSAYNLFFRSEREKLVGISSSDDDATTSTNNNGKRRRREAHGKIGFADLARNISAKWKKLDKKARDAFEAKAEVERARYKKEVEEWKRNKEFKAAQQTQAAFLLEQARLLQEQQQQEQQCMMMAAASAGGNLDADTMVANFLARSAANLRMSRQLRGAAVLPLPPIPEVPLDLMPSFPSGSQGGFIGASSATVQNGNQRSISAKHEEREELSSLDPISLEDANGNSERNNAATISNDLLELDALDEMLANFKSDQQVNDFSSLIPDIGKDDSLAAMLANGSTSTQPQQQKSKVSLDSLIHDCLGSSSTDADRELSDYIKSGCMGPLPSLGDSMMSIPYNNSNDNDAFLLNEDLTHQ